MGEVYDLGELRLRRTVIRLAEAALPQPTSSGLRLIGGRAVKHAAELSELQQARGLTLELAAYASRILREHHHPYCRLWYEQPGQATRVRLVPDPHIHDLPSEQVWRVLYRPERFGGVVLNGQGELRVFTGHDPDASSDFTTIASDYRPLQPIGVVESAPTLTSEGVAHAMEREAELQQHLAQLAARYLLPTPSA